MEITFEQACQNLRACGFFRIAHKVAIHHMRKDFLDYDVTNDAFYIKAVGNDFLHVAVVEFRTVRNIVTVQVRYTQAADDLLYGLRIKYREGDPTDPVKTINDIAYRSKRPSLVRSKQYVRLRFNGNRSKAKTRALFVMLSDLWKKHWPFAK